MRYRPISIKMWGDDRFKRLSKPVPNGQTLWIYLLTGEHTTALPGGFVAGEAALAEALDWPIASFRKAFAEVLHEGLAEVDRSTRLVFLPKAVRHNPPQSPNVVIAWRKAFDDLPDCELKQRIYHHIVSELRALGKSEAYVEAFGKAFEHAFVESEQNRTVTEQKGMGTRARKTSVPMQLEITGAMRSWATENQITVDLDSETEHMLDHFRGKGESRLDWVATWRTWMRNSKKWGHSNNGNGSKSAAQEQPTDMDAVRREQIRIFGKKAKLT
jgi:hypothetical protein